jgi:cytochrome c oxidase subunit 2
LVVVATIWLIVTAASLWWLSSLNLHPIAASTNAEIIDEAFDLLLLLATPVMTFVLVVLGYSLIRFRATPGQDGDAPAIRSNRVFIAGWLIVTVVLSVYVIFDPGFSGIDALAADTDQEMTIDVVASQWNWDFSYIDQGVQIEEADELVLPIDTRILFRITSEDVIHSFWVPAFRVKMDAVPGLTTEIYMTATELGTFAEDDNFRTQCAELCGTGHARMSTTVTVLSRADFDQWVEEVKAEGNA